MAQSVDKRATIPPTAQPSAFIEVRGSDGRLYGRFCLEQLLLEVRKGRQVEVIDLKRLPRM